jgi:predicted aldo/keto reductase-like oxidoreductase
MEAYNHYLLYGEFGKVKDRLRWHWGINDLSDLDRCTECRQCEEECTQKLPIVERFEHIRELANGGGVG